MLVTQRNNYLSRLYAFVAHIFQEKIKMVIKVKKFYAEELEIYFKLSNVIFTRKNDEGDYQLYQVEPLIDEQIEFLELIPAQII